MKYLRDEKLAWEAPLNKAKLPLGKCKGIYVAPLSIFDQAIFDQAGINPDIDPDLVFFMCSPYQAYHILNDYMGAMGP